MPSLAQCLTDVGQALSPQDRSKLNQYIDEGMTPEQALDALTADVRAEMDQARGINFEVAPDPDNIEANNRFNALSPDLKRSVSHSVAEAMIPAVMDYLGVDTYSVESTTGGYLDETNPSLVITAPDADLGEIGALLGYIGSQQSVVVYDESKPGNASVLITPKKALSFSEQETLYREIREQVPEVGGYTWRDGSMVIGNFSDMSDTDFKAAIDKAVAGKHPTSTKEFYSDLMETTSYDQRNSDTDRLKADFQREFNRQVRLHRSVRFKDTDGREDGVLVRPPIKDGQTTITHFSGQEGLTVLDPSYYGTNWPGAEKARANDEVWLPRVYFGFEPGTPGGYKKEAGVGNNRYDVKIPAHMMYDIDNDPDGLLAGIPKPKRSFTMEEYELGLHKVPESTVESLYEKAIYDAGYMGYYTNHPQMGLIAASFEPIDLKQKRPVALYQSALALRKGRETLRKYGLKPGKRHKTRDVAAAMEARTREKSGTIARNDRSPEAAAKIARWMVQEVKFELEHPEHSGVGWYSEKYQRAIDVMAQDFPELVDDQNARDTLTALIAITSDGQKVGPNFKHAYDIYDNFRKTGKFETDRKHVRQGSIDTNLKNLQQLYDSEMSVEEIHKYLMREERVSDLNARAKADGIEFSTDYPVDMKLPMAALVFGPKLGAFYGNLMGAHGYLTMDRWWSRTINRYRGTLLTKPTQSSMDTFKKLLGDPDLSNDEVLLAVIPYAQNYSKRKHKFKANQKNPSTFITRLEIKLGRKKGKTPVKEWRKLGEQYPELLLEDTLERAANTVYKAAYVDLEDAPFNSSDRRFMVDSVNRAQKSLKRSGIEMSVADIQATMWYYEKRLYGEMGAQMTADVSYEDAALAAVKGSKVKGTQEPEDFLVLNQAAYHGTPHVVAPRFSTSEVGKGEGHAAQGWGLYFASNIEIARWYRDKLSKKQLDKTEAGRIAKSYLRIHDGNNAKALKDLRSTLNDAIVGGSPQPMINFYTEAVGILETGVGNLYRVELAPKDEEWLLWDESMVNQSSLVLRKLRSIDLPEVQEALQDFELNTTTGQTIYNILSRNLGSQKAASMYLHHIGVRGNKYLDAVGRVKGTDDYNFVIFHDDDVEITEQLEQYERGRIVLFDNQRIIQLGRQSDLSTFLHESGHLFLEMEKLYARKYGLSENQKAILDWLGLDSFDDITKEHHERWAETFEVYLREGKAPSLGLRRAFAAFARWLKIIYRTIQGDHLARADLGPEIKEIFDRLLATEAEIQEAAGRPEYDELYKSKEQAGVTDAQWKKYLEAKERAKNTAERTLDEKVLQQYMRTRQKEWNEEKAPLVEAEKERLRKEPIYQVMSDLKGDKANNIPGVPFDTDALRALFPDGKIPNRFIGLHAKEGGTDPAIYAEDYNFPSAKAMIKEIMSKPTLNQAAEENAEKQMVEKYGDILNDGTLEQEVREAMVNEDQARLLMMEINMSKKQNAPKINRNYLKAQAEIMIGKMKYSEIKPNKYYQAMIRAAKESMIMEDPMPAKIQQLVNHYLYKEALAVRERMDKNRRFVRGGQTRNYDTKKVDSDHVQQIKMLSSMYEMRKGPDQLVALDSILNFYVAQVSEKEGELRDLHDGTTDLSLLDPNLVRAIEYRNTHGGSLQGFELVQFDDMTSQDLQGVVDMMRHLRWAGGEIAKMNSEESIRERMELAQHLRDKGGKDSRARRTGVPKPGQDVVRHWNHLINTFPSLANMIRKLDGNEDGGMAFKMIYQKVADGVNRKFELHKTFYDEIVEKTKRLSEAKLNRRDGEVFQLESGEDSEPLSSEARFMIGLYWGTESSRDAIRDGFGMTDNDVMRILSTLSQDQLEMLNVIWEMNESQWPEVRDAAIDMLGVAPPKLDATPFIVNGVQLTGGHMQLYYDSQRNELKNEQESSVKVASMAPSKAGTLNARVGSGGQPVLLDINNITRSVDDKIHYIAFARIGRELRQIINHDDIKGVIERKHGAGFYRAFIESIDGITSGRLAHESHATAARISRWMRSAATLMHLGYSIRNTVQQLGALPIAMFNDVGPVKFTQASLQLLNDRKATVAWVNQRSKFMENRAQVVNREAREFLKEVVSTSKVGRRWQRFKSASFVLQTTFDSTIAYPTWLAAYQNGMEQHGDEKRAITEADTMVAQSVGSGSDLHLGRAFQSNQNEFIKTLTIFGSWFNAYYQRLYRSTKGGTDFMNMQALRDAVILPFIVANITQALIMDTPDDDETMGEYLFKNTWMFLVGTLPGVRELASISMGFTPSQPINTLPVSIVRSVNETKAWLNGDQTGPKALIDIGKATTGVVKAPGSGQVWRALDYLESYRQGEEDGFNPYQMMVEGPDKDK